MELIIHCCRVYNGEDTEITEDCELFVEKLRKELKSYINSNKDRNASKKKQAIPIGNKE